MAEDRGRPMDKASRRMLLIQMVGALGLIVLGQVYFIWRPQYVWDGVIFCCVGALLWAAALGRLGSRPPRMGWLGQVQTLVVAHLHRTAVLGLGAILVLWAGLRAVRAPADKGFGLPLAAWAVGLGLFVTALVPQPDRSTWQRWLQRLRFGWVENLALGALLAAALTARAVALETVPANFGGDEGTQALAALRLWGPPLGNPFSTGWYSVPTMSFLAYGLAMRVFGFTVAGARALSALLGTATVLATFFLAREMAGRWAGWTAAAVVAFGHFAIHFSRLASNQVADGLFSALTLYLLLRGLRDQGRSSLLWFGLAGVVLGLSWYGYFGARMITVTVALYLAWRASVEPRFLARQGPGLLLLFGGALLAVAPLGFHYLSHPAEFLSRYNQVSIFASGWLEREMAVTGRSATALLLDQFWKSVSAFHVTPDPTFWYHPGIPLLDPVSGLFFLVGLVTATVRARRPSEGLLLIWFWSLVLLGWSLTENPPSSQRAVGVVPVAGLLTALGLLQVAELIRVLSRGALRGWGDETPLVPARRATAEGRPYLVGTVLAVIALVNLVFYFGVYTPRRVYGNPTAEVADVLCDALLARPAVPPVYFDGAPVMYWGFGALAFRLRHLEGRDFSPAEGFAGIDLSRGALFVVLGEKLADLNLIQDGLSRDVGQVEPPRPYYSPVDGRLLFVVYEVPPRGWQ